MHCRVVVLALITFIVYILLSHISSAEVSGTISANPANLNLFPNTRGLTVISWNVEGTSGQVWVSMDNKPETLFASGKSGSQDAFWIVCPHNYTFSLYSSTTHTTKLSSVTVTSSCKKEEFLLGVNQIGGHTDYQTGFYWPQLTPWNLTDQDLATLKQDLHINSILFFIHPRFLGLNQLTWNGKESIDYTKFKDSDYVWYRPGPEIDSFDEVIEQLNRFDIKPVFRIFPVGEYLHYMNRGDITFLSNQSNMYGPYKNPLNYTGIVPVEQMKNLSVTVAKHMHEKFGDNFGIVYMEICHTGDKCSIREVNESSKWSEVIRAIKGVAPGSQVFSPEIIPWNGYQRNKILNAVPPYTGVCRYVTSFYACDDEWMKCDKFENYAKVFDYPAFSFYPPGPIMCNNADYPIIDMKNVIMDFVRDHTSGKKWIYAESGTGSPMYEPQRLSPEEALDNYHVNWANILLFTDNSLGIFIWDAKNLVKNSTSCVNHNCLNSSLIDQYGSKKEPYYSFVAKIYTLIDENKNFFSTYHSRTNADGIPVEDDLFTENDPQVLTRHIGNYLAIFSMKPSSVTFTNVNSKILQEYANLENPLAINYDGNSVTVSNILENRTYVLKIVTPITSSTTTSGTTISTSVATTIPTSTTSATSTTIDNMQKCLNAGGTCKASCAAEEKDFIQNLLKTILNWFNELFGVVQPKGSEALIGSYPDYCTEQLPKCCKSHFVFKPINFTLNGITNEIGLSFNNSLQENGIILFIITNEQGLVVDYFNKTVSKGLGSISELVNCTSLGVGNYTISWEAYLESDNKLLNAKAWSKPDEWKKVECK